MDGLTANARRLWRTIAPRSLRTLAQPVRLRLAEARARSALKAGEPLAQPGPIIVSGLLAESKGVSEGARLTIAGLRAAGLNPIAHDIRPSLSQGPGAHARLPTEKPGGAWITHINAPEMVHALACTDPAQWLGRRRIGYWAYELQPIPKSWARFASLLHEIWTPSAFVAEAIRQAGVTIPVRSMPHPVHLGPKPNPDRPRFGISPDVTAILAMGDLNSSATRKNLQGAIDIFHRAFPNPGRTRLIVKTLADAEHPAFHEQAAKAARGRADISFLAETFSRDDTANLIASVDIVLSPHRAEGYGLTLAEAFLAGIPALATDWSGNMDFMVGLDPLLIRSRLVPVHDPSGVYAPAGRQWAEPDPADAATKLAALASNPDLRHRYAAHGQMQVLKLAEAWSPESLANTALGGVIPRG